MCNGPIQISFELDPELRRAEGATEVFHVGKTKGIAGVGRSPRFHTTIVLPSDIC